VCATGKKPAFKLSSERGYSENIVQSLNSVLETLFYTGICVWLSFPFLTYYRPRTINFLLCGAV
jgi:hypothetical protein